MSGLIEAGKSILELLSNAFLSDLPSLSQSPGNFGSEAPMASLGQMNRVEGRFF